MSVRLPALMMAAVLFVFSYASICHADASCVAKECHAKLLDNKFVHGPVGAYECQSCHTAIDKHKFKMAAEGAELCYLCHDKKNTKAHVHGPVASGDCVGCHNPHSSPYKFQLAAEGPNLCFKCYEDNKPKNKFVHGPVAAGDCIACHDPHTSPNDFQLLAPGNDLCFTCHVDKKDEFSAGKQVHPPVADRCTNCHNAHSSANKYQLNQPAPQLCYTCHNKPMGEISNMKAWLDANPDKHGPVRNGDCVSCHSPHGANYFRILKDYFPTEFYAPYSTDKYALCFDCHNKDISIDEFTTTLTGFRNGDKNMHFVHVNKTPKGRTCRACHEVHAGKQAKHIREKVPFGKLSYPIRFTKTENGGSCIVGCHVERGYDRVTPVKNR